MLTMDERTCKECNEVFNDAEGVRRHLRKHSMNTQEYTLKWNYGNQPPKCRCGCGLETSWNVALKRYADHVHGHHAWGRKKTDDEKRRAGEKNSVNMKRYMAENPNIARARNAQMLAAHTPEVTDRRLATTRQTYASMSDVDKQGFRDRTRQRWETGELAQARVKGAETFRQRSADGVYDFTERNDKLSETISQMYVEGGFTWSRGNHTSTKTGKTCYYRSSWELMLMKQLDSDDDVIDWKSEPMTLPYPFEGSTHRYVPDFLVIRSSGVQLIEVKPQSLRNVARNVAKRAAAEEFCVELGWTYVEWEPGTA